MAVTTQLKVKKYFEKISSFPNTFAFIKSSITIYNLQSNLRTFENAMFFTTNLDT